MIASRIRISEFSMIVVCLFLASNAKAEDETATFHFQTTTVTQEHPGFSAKYSGLNSLTTAEDNQTSVTFTAFAGLRLLKSLEFYINPELAGGSGFNQTKGIAGFPNGEIYRVDDPTPKWNLARLVLKQTFELGDEKEEIKDDKNQLATNESVKRLTLTFGKFALNDYFDNNTYSHDPRTQFLNWALMDSAAWDYAADTRGYSWGFYLEFNQPSWTIRLASVLVPKQANQLEMETDFPRFRGDNLEYERRYKIANQQGAFRVLLYENHANMGNYRSTLDTQVGLPGNSIDVTKTRALSVKYGIGFNVEQAITSDLGLFARASRNDGHTETWAFTEVDEALSFGASLKGRKWRRENDTAGLAFMSNGLSDDHKAYLAAGGYGFMIGDGKLSYSPELIGELYYLYKVIPGLDLSSDYQFLANPAYNSERGPVSIFSIRVHYEI